MLITLPSPFPPSFHSRRFAPAVAVRRAVASRPLTDADLYAELGPMATPARSATTRPPTTGVALLASGLAAPYAVRSAPGLLRGRAVVVLPGAFAASLAAVGDGRHRVRLLVNHDAGREIAVTGGGGIVLAVSPAGLRLGIVASPAGRAAIGFLRGNPSMRYLSAGFRVADSFTDADGALHVRRAYLNEVSLVTAGAFPGTRIELKS